jgi:uncharacterized repeat protein (TIGR02543 family)
MKFKITLLIVLSVLVSKMGVGQVSLTNVAASNTQNFDAMGTSATASLPANWKMSGAGLGSSSGWATATNVTAVSQQASSGSPTAGGRYNWGTSTTERSLGVMTSGSYASTSGIMSFYTNDGTTNITALTISYDLERYRINTAAASVLFYYSINGTSWITVAAGDIATAALPTGTSAYNYTTTGAPSSTNCGVINKSNITISSLNIAPSSSFYLKWVLNTSGGNSQGIGIDNVVCTATFSPPTYSLTYDGNGNTSGAVPVDATSPYVAAATVTTLGNTGSLAKTGSTFTGWNTAVNGSGTAQAVASTFSMPAVNTILYAQWTTNNYTISFDANTGSGSMTNQTIAYGAAANLTSNSFSKTGYSFAGWNTLANGTGTLYANAQSYTMGAANATLYAQWTANDNTLTFDGNGATSGSTAAQTIATNASANLTSNGFIRTGYNFTGWSTTAGGSVTYADGASYTMGTSNTTLYAVWTVASLPTISYSGSLTSVNTSYGTASISPATFAVSGSSLSDNIILTAPSGYELSSGSGYSTTLILIQSGGVVSSITINVRLAATTAVGTYAGTIVLTSTGATSVNVSTVSSAVSPLVLTISGLTGTNKEYDGTAAATYAGTASYVGLVNGESFTVTGTPSATFTTAGVGTSKPITVTGYTAPSLNYTLTQPTLSADITTKALTVSGASAANKPYDGTTTASITGGSLIGVISPDAVTLTQAGNFVTANVGAGIAVTPNFSISGADAGNYTLTQPSGLSADITQGSQTITFGPLANQTVGVADYAPGATASSGLTVTYISSNPAVATIVGGLIHVVGVGTTTITASQAGNGTYLAASDVNQSLTINNPPLAAWEVSSLVGGANNFGPNPLDTISANANVLITKLTRGAGIIITSGTAAASAWGGTGVNNTSFANALSGNDFITFGVKAKPGYTVSFSEIPAYNIRRSNTGATTGQWQYQLNSGSFVDIGSSITWGTTTSGAGNLQSSINLSGITALQEVPSSINVTFRLVIWGGTSAGGTWYINNISGNDLQVLGSVSDYVSPLPVEFLEFTAKCNESSETVLNWSTASEHNSDYFKIEKSIDGVNWSILATVAAAGNSTERIDYTLVDNEKSSGAYYKLWQYDVDGSESFLALVHDDCSGSFSDAQPVVYPNPTTNNALTIQFNDDKADVVKVEIYSLQGKLMYSQTFKGAQKITIADLTLDKGIYQMTIQQDGKDATNSKICIQ